MSKLSEEFHAILSNGAKVIDIAEFEQCLTEWKQVHDKATMSQTALAILFFCIGLWAVYEQAIVVAVFFLGLAVSLDHSATLVGIQSNSVTSHRLLAMLINKQSQAIELLRQEFKDQECSRNA